MCIPKSFLGIDFDGDGNVSEFESFLTYQAVNGVLDKQDSAADLDDADELYGLDDTDSFGGADSFDDE